MNERHEEFPCNEVINRSSSNFLPESRLRLPQIIRRNFTSGFAKRFTYRRIVSVMNDDVAVEKKKEKFIRLKIYQIYGRSLFIFG